MPKDKVKEDKKKHEQEQQEPQLETDEDEFDQAFDDAMNERESETTTSEDAGKDTSEEEGRDDGSEEEQTTSQLEKDESDQDDASIFNRTPEDEESESDSVGDEESEVSTEQKIANLEASLEKEKQRTSSWEGRISAANRRAEEAEAKLKELQKDKSTAKDSSEHSPTGDEDDVVLGEFIEEFPSLEKPIKVLATKIARDIVKRELGEITPQISEVRDTVKSREAHEHVSKITQAHPDWKSIYESGALSRWIGSQPQFMQPGLQRVVQEGSAEEVIEMFSAYKSTSRHLKKQTDNTGSKASNQRKAKNLEAVRHSSSGPPADKKQVAEDDFDGAWEEAVSRG